MSDIKTPLDCQHCVCNTCPKELYEPCARCAVCKESQRTDSVMHECIYCWKLRRIKGEEV